MPALAAVAQELQQNRDAIIAEACRRSLFKFVQVHWDEVIPEAPVWNWHIAYLCREVQDVITRAAMGLPKKEDVLINIPPGTTKSTIAVQMAPAWAWTNWPFLRFICGSYSGDLSTEHGGLCKDIVQSGTYRRLFPEIGIRPNYDARSNFRISDVNRITEQEDGTEKIERIKGGQRVACSVGGTVTGKHAHVILVDDPLNPKEATSDVQLRTANHWMTSTLSTRKIDKAITPTILVMQRLHENDPSGDLLSRKGKRVKHICLPGFCEDNRGGEKVVYDVKPALLKNYYKDGLLDPERMGWDVLDEMALDLGVYGFSGQVGQNPAPPTGGLFKVDQLEKRIVDVPPSKIKQVIRYWDKAGTEGGGAFTAGGQLAEMVSGGYIILDMVRGQWGPDNREAKMRKTAEDDGDSVRGYIEQEPGSGGKDSALATIRNLKGFPYYADRPTGDKVYRADPFAAQVNAGNVWVMRGDWNRALIEEMRLFPNGKYKDQVDALSGAFSKMNQKRTVGALRTAKDKRRRK